MTISGVEWSVPVCLVCEGVVRDEGEAGDAAQEVAHGQAGQQRSAVVVQSPRPPQHHQGQAVTNCP